MAQVAVNARFYSHRATGMQRYAIELARRFGDRVDCVRPEQPLAGARGHLWEQVYLPTVVGRRLLWSPNNTGPLAIANQVCTIHDLIPLDRPEWFNPRFARWYAWLMPRLARKARHVIAISQFTKSRLLDLFGLPEGKVTVVPNGVDERFRPATEAAVQEARAKLGVPAGDYFLCVGSLEPRKNLAGLLRAWQVAADRLPHEVSLVIAGAQGRGEVFASANLPAAPPRTRFTGFVPDELLPALYSGAMGVAYPSLYEGFGLPPLEAMACGAPVITSRGTSLPEVTGDAAMLVDESNSEAIAAAMIELARNSGLQQQLRHAGRVRAAQFTWQETAKRTWAVLEAYA